MLKIEKKIIKNKPFYYLAEQIRTESKYKKIQVYLGKNIPNDLSNYYGLLKNKEKTLFLDNIAKIYKLDPILESYDYNKIEDTRVEFKYLFLAKSDFQLEQFWRDFAIKFIFESNAIEGSRLSEKEVENIVKKKYLKKDITKKEILEVENSIKAFKLINSKSFKLNQRTIVNLHKILVDGLEIETGYKKKEIIVNNKKTTSPGDVRRDMASLMNWWAEQTKKRVHPFTLAAKFHQRFELIHPFSDGNGRTGRLLFNWMLLDRGYGVILFKNKNRQSYFSALSQADEGRSRKLYRHCIKVYKKTLENVI